jgi:hypothetical protein
VVWDNCSGSDINALWDGHWPNAGTADYQMQYRIAPYRGISAPHNRVGRYMTGCYGNSAGANAGWNVMVWKARTLGPFPQYTYVSWYQRCDDAWVFGGDDNFKNYDWSRGKSPYGDSYGVTYNWYSEYNSRPTSKSSGCSWHLNDDAYGTNSANLENTSSWWGSDAVNPMSGQWSKIEHYIKLSNQAGGGVVKIVENGVVKLNVSTKTDGMAGTDRCDAIGGYARQSGQPNNFRYFADLYLDYTWQHVVLGDASTIGACKILECQKVASWTDTSINITVNRGALSDSAIVYLYVYDANGTPNTTGFPVPVSGTPPSQPSNLRIS